jgi:hypothetical protein
VEDLAGRPCTTCGCEWSSETGRRSSSSIERGVGMRRCPPACSVSPRVHGRCRGTSSPLVQPSEVRQRRRSPHHSGLLLRMPDSARHAPRVGLPPRSTPQPDWSPPPLELRVGIDSMEQRGRGAQGKRIGRSQQVNSWGVRWTFRMPGPTCQCVLTVDF